MVVDRSLLAVGWPGEPAVVVSAWRAGAWHELGAVGDLDAPRPWASVTKLVTALAAAIDLHEGRATLEDPVGPTRATLAHLLSHASGLGFEAGDPVIEPGVKRIYSNFGIDLAGAHLATEGDVARWLTSTVLAPLEMTSARVVGRASEGVVGSTRDLARLGREWVTPSLLTRESRDASVAVAFPDLSGTVPGFGRFTPCPWGLGPEVRGPKNHWMGDWPADSFGHFGRSGALVLANATLGIVVAATSTVDFGPWARDAWPAWTSRVRRGVPS